MRLVSLLALSIGLTSFLRVEAQDPMATPSGFEVGAQVSDYLYREPDLGVKLSGHRWGAAAAYTVNPGGEAPFIRFDGRFSRGSLDYEGSGTLNGVPDELADLRVLVGKDYFPKQRYGLAPYLGLGYRYLHNDLRGVTSTGAIGYRRISEYFYLPAGLTARIPLSSQWVLVPSAEFDLFLQGHQQSKLSDVDPAAPDAQNDQTSGHGYRLSALLERGHFSIGPWYQYWKIQRSDYFYLGYGWVAYEPDNSTREFGLEARYRF